MELPVQRPVLAHAAPFQWRRRYPGRSLGRSAATKPVGQTYASVRPAACISWIHSSMQDSGQVSLHVASGLPPKPSE